MQWSSAFPCRLRSWVVLTHWVQAQASTAGRHTVLLTRWVLLPLFQGDLQRQEERKKDLLHFQKKKKLCPATSPYNRVSDKACRHSQDFDSVVLIPRHEAVFLTQMSKFSFPYTYRKLLGNTFYWKITCGGCVFKYNQTTFLFCFKDWPSIANMERSLLILKEITYLLVNYHLFSTLIYTCFKLHFSRWSVHTFIEKEYLKNSSQKIHVKIRQAKGTLNRTCSTASSELTWNVDRHLSKQEQGMV